MSSPTHIRVSSEELPPLREAMRDVQVAVAAYYAETARTGDLGGRVRIFLVSAQTLNDLLANSISDASSYKTLLAADSRSNLVEAVKYARNVTQHVLHIVKPSDDNRLIGGTLGLRLYAQWDEIPARAHEKLRRATQKLKASYDTTLQGREVTSTMLTFLRIYAELAPEIVHRDERGEWTGFPLMNQPGVGAPLHPEEPNDIVDAQAWLNNRLPNGDSRVVCGQVTLDDTRNVVGFTFAGRYSFSPFVETVEQIRRDLAAGFPYLAGDVSENVEDATGLFPLARQGGVLASRGDVASWASPIPRIERAADWCVGFEANEWRRITVVERASAIPAASAYEVRRARRLNAFVPPGT